MSRYLIINNGVVVDIVDQEGEVTKGSVPVEFDTVTIDPNSLYTVGDVYTLEDYLAKYPPTTSPSNNAPQDQLDTLISQLLSGT